MVLFNYSTKEITAKVVYYGPGLCGKTTNLQFIYDNMPKNIQRGRMLSLATKTDRTLFFDFLPLDLGSIRDMKTRVQLYTVPGQVFYNSTRKLVLKGADGIVFVADSQTKMKDANLESFRNLEENCIENGIDLAETPLVLQFNKRDLPDLLSLEDLNDVLNKHNAPFFESVATTGIGVHETLKGITKLVIHNLQQKHLGEREADSVAEGAGEAVAAQGSMTAPEAAVPLASTPEPPVAPVNAAPPADAVPLAPAPVVPDVPPAPAEPAPPVEAAAQEPRIIEGLLRRADPGPAAEATESFSDLTAEFDAPRALAAAPTTDRAEGAVAPPVRQPPAPVALEEQDPLGLGRRPQAAPPMAPPATALPVVLQPGQEEVHIPLEVRSGENVERYRLRLRISLGRED